jgi:hypothetical protein
MAGSGSRPEHGADGNHRGVAGVGRVNDFGVVDALEVDRRDAEIAVPELSLDDDQRHALARRRWTMRVHASAR